jgi:hypothetical protein
MAGKFTLGYTSYTFSIVARCPRTQMFGVDIAGALGYRVVGAMGMHHTVLLLTAEKVVGASPIY